MIDLHLGRACNLLDSSGMPTFPSRLTLLGLPVSARLVASLSIQPRPEEGLPSGISSELLVAEAKVLLVNRFDPVKVPEAVPDGGIVGAPVVAQAVRQPEAEVLLGRAGRRPQITRDRRSVEPTRSVAREAGGPQGAQERCELAAREDALDVGARAGDHDGEPQRRRRAVGPHVEEVLDLFLATHVVEAVQEEVERADRRGRRAPVDRRRQRRGGEDAAPAST